MIQAVIFDMDGTLFDTEIMYAHGWYAAGVTREQYFQMIGRSEGANDRALSSWGLDPVQVRRIRNATVQRELKEKGVPLKPGTVRVLRWLRGRRIPAAVATSSPIGVAEDYMRISGLGEYFDAVLSGFQLEHGKPAPDLFLMAAKELHTDPRECMVVEDSFNGVRAGHSAGMVTVMIPDLVEPDDEIRSVADVILPSLLELPGYIDAVHLPAAPQGSTSPVAETGNPISSASV